MKWASYFCKCSVAGQGATDRYAPGDRVQVRQEPLRESNSTPYCIRGKTGLVEEVRGPFADRKDPPLGRDRPSPQPLYQIRFQASDVWPESPGAPGDTLAVAIGEDWLEAASQRLQSGRSQTELAGPIHSSQ